MVNFFLNNLNIPKLSEEQKQSCKGDIPPEEIKSILESFQNNKSPGNDGIPIEFYKTCWNLISDSLSNVLMNLSNLEKCLTRKEKHSSL